MKLIFATNNEHKVQEIRHAIGNDFELLSLKEAGIDIDIPEPHDTIEENASEKSRVIYEMTHTNCFSEDTGLEVTALGGEPGVHSARYAGDERSFEKNIDKVLTNLARHTDRSARFRTVISLILDGKETRFEGICTGRIVHERRGSGGFGYDPVFIPDGADISFAEMTLAEKEQFSHRAKATAKLVAFLASVTSFGKSLETKTKT
ncbi:MAG TPA: RdgB/HAM1 family non-canonical purine NTP pyrophosphatase [Chitinophagaceae bacterium]|nr:RdgB/HAM1 family non-canonical purine NTP pyrophosphatase [Chitinophagaceae bacterium]